MNWRSNFLAFLSKAAIFYLRFGLGVRSLNEAVSFVSNKRADSLISDCLLDCGEIIFLLFSLSAFLFSWCFKNLFSFMSSRCYCFDFLSWKRSLSINFWLCSLSNSSDFRWFDWFFKF